MKEEIWKDILEYEGLYQVSNKGNVKSLKREVDGKKGSIRILQERILKPGVNGHGYLTINLCKNGYKKTRTIHQLVAESFLNHTPDGTMEICVDHINHDRTDNQVDNLRLVSPRENQSNRKGKKINKYSSHYVGVCFDKQKNKWRACIRINGKQKHLGLFDTELEASEVYQVAKNKLVIEL